VGPVEGEGRASDCRDTRRRSFASSFSTWYEKRAEGRKASSSSIDSSANPAPFRIGVPSPAVKAPSLPDVGLSLFPDEIGEGTGGAAGEGGTSLLPHPPTGLHGAAERTVAIMLPEPEDPPRPACPATSAAVGATIRFPLMSTPMPLPVFNSVRRWLPVAGTALLPVLLVVRGVASAAAKEDAVPPPVLLAEAAWEREDECCGLLPAAPFIRETRACVRFLAA